MKIKSGFIALSILSATVLAAGPGLAASGGASPGATITVAEGPAAPDTGRPPPIRPMTDLEKNAVGCLVSGGGALAATYAAGPSELVMLMMGGLVVPSSSSVLFISLIGTITSVACGAGVAVAPLADWAIGRVSHAFASAPGGDRQVAEMPKSAQ